MTWFIVFLVFAMLVSPIAWLIPSTSQKRIEAMRAEARKQGFHVQLVSLPQTRREQVRKQEVIQGACYRLPWRDDLRCSRECQFLRDQPPEERAGDWPEACFDALPSSVVALDSNRLGTAMYWREQGEPEQLVSAVGVLQDWQAQLQALNRKRPRASGD